MVDAKAGAAPAQVEMLKALVALDRKERGVDVETGEAVVV
jgi:hypothetical protein